MSGLRRGVRVERSKVAGVAVVADEVIPAGTIWWERTDFNCLKITRAQYQTLYNSTVEGSEYSEKLWNGIFIYSYYVKAEDCIFLVLDDGRFVNHSDDPNSRMIEGRYSITLRDVYPGEELFESYNQYDDYPWPEPWDHQEVKADVQKEYLDNHPLIVMDDTALVRNECYVAEGSYGYGLFVGVDVKAGDIAWEPEASTMLLVKPENWQVFNGSQMALSSTSSGLHEAILWYGFYEAVHDAIIVCLDNARFVNHSELGTIVSKYEGELGFNVFTRDIPAGSEIVDDYREYNVCPWAEMTWEPYVDGYRFRN